MIDAIWLVPIIGTTFFVSLIGGTWMAEWAWRADCIRRNVARYHPQTGKWEWTVEEKE